MGGSHGCPLWIGPLERLSETYLGSAKSTALQASRWPGRAEVKGEDDFETMGGFGPVPGFSSLCPDPCDLYPERGLRQLPPAQPGQGSQGAGKLCPLVNHGNPDIINKQAADTVPSTFHVLTGRSSQRPCFQPHFTVEKTGQLPSPQGHG